MNELSRRANGVEQSGRSNVNFVTAAYSRKMPQLWLYCGMHGTTISDEAASNQCSTLFSLVSWTTGSIIIPPQTEFQRQNSTRYSFLENFKIHSPCHRLPLQKQKNPFHRFSNKINNSLWELNQLYPIHAKKNSKRKSEKYYSSTCRPFYDFPAQGLIASIYSW